MDAYSRASYFYSTSCLHDKYPTTFAIIDGSEVFIETPSDLQMQSSTWSNYKHHNTAKCLIACTPNGAVCYISPLYVGSVSDVELTRVSGFIQKLEGRSGMSRMADQKFTIKDMIKIGVDLNIPPFLEGQKQLPAEEVKKGRQIASIQIHVECAIGRIKKFSILKGNFPLSMIQLTNQIVCVCAWLSNFQPTLNFQDSTFRFLMTQILVQTLIVTVKYVDYVLIILIVPKMFYTLTVQLTVK